MYPAAKIILALVAFTSLVFSQGKELKEISFPVGYDYEIGSSRRISSGAMLSGVYVDLQNNTYWVKSGTIESGNGEVIVNFEKELTINNIRAIDQVKAINGYIVEVVRGEKGASFLYVWIANEKGERDSDDIIIEIK